MKSINDRNARALFVHGLTEGKTEIVVSATGYASEVISVEVTPSGFVFSTLDFSLKSTDPNRGVTISPRRLAPGTLKIVETQSLRAGLANVEVAIQADSTAPGLFSPSTVVLLSGFSSGTIQFDPKLAGTVKATLAQPTGYTAPSDGKALLTVTVTP